MDRYVLLVWFLVCGLVLVEPGMAQNVRSPDLNAQYHRAETAWKSGASMLEAKARVDRVLEARPDDAEALRLRAQVLMGMGRLDDALRDARRAVAVAPRTATSQLVLCEVARHAGEREVAAQALQDASELVFDDAALHVRLSWNAVLLEQVEKAEAFARTALALDGENPSAYYQLARVFVLQGEDEAAATVLRNGFQRALLDPSTVRSDSVLTDITDHPVVRPYVN
ncbi:MAG: tetratricopeptide repeat protein [Bacteroidetes bacterium]|jgi:tetratricopeptide (TPR) repeat protein|nr:tetratricopeptide repeat protein [Bacteroidota bacterium]